MNTFPLISDRIVKAAAASNYAAQTRKTANAMLNRMVTVDSPEQLTPSCRQQCGTRVGAAMVVYGN